MIQTNSLSAPYYQSDGSVYVCSFVYLWYTLHCSRLSWKALIKVFLFYCIFIPCFLFRITLSSSISHISYIFRYILIIFIFIFSHLQTTFKMPKPLVNSCCLCQSTRNGSVISGILAIVLSILTIILIFTTRVHFKTIVFDFIPNDIVKIILVINLCMTILISLLMIAGVLKVSIFP